MGLQPLFAESEEWPSVNCSLLAAGNDWRQSAWVGWSQHGDPDTRIRGFRVAAELIGLCVRETGVAQDGLIFPFVHAWRQHIELSLKQLIVAAELLDEVEAPAPSGHDLLGLWHRCRSALGQRGSDEDLENVERIIAEFGRLDPSGEVFRYATSKDGSPTLMVVKELSCESIGRALASASNLLDCAHMQVAVELEARADILA